MAVWDGKHGVYLIAEIGGNHEGNFEYAQELAELACTSGADAVKFQIYTSDSLVSSIESPDRHAHFEKFTLRPEQYTALAKQCHRHGVTFTASVWDPTAFDWIDEHMRFYKIGSGDLTAYPLMKAVAQMSKPIVLSTGLATLREVEEAVAYLQNLDQRYSEPEYLALLQCTSMYPIPDSDANLNVITSFRERFGVTTGYSDHTVGMEGLKTAVAMGAEILEFHFTDSREGKSFRDHKVSLTQAEVAELIECINQIKILQGSYDKSPMTSEIDNGHVTSFRRAVYPARDLAKGTVLTASDLTVLRPNHGIDARDFDKLIGKQLKYDVQAHQKLSWDDIGDDFGD